MENRNRSAKARRLAKRRLVEGVTVRVTRFLNLNESFEYDAVLHLETQPCDDFESVKCVLEPVRAESHRRIKEARFFLGAYRINLSWWNISAIPIELSRHTEIGTTMTAIVMNHIQVW